MTKDKKKSCKGLIILVIIILLFALVIGSDDSSSTPTNNDNTSETTTEEAIAFKDNNMKIEYRKIEKLFDIEGCLYLTLKIDNTTDKIATVSLADVSINGNSIQTGTGMPITIYPDESSSQPFILFLTGTDIQEADEVNNIKLKVVFNDENYNEFASSDRISIEIK